MTLTIGTGPFGDQGDKTFNFEVQAPRDHVLFFEDSPHRVRVMFGDRVRALSLHVFSVLFSYVLILLLPVLLWPRACLVRDRLTPLG